MAEMYFNHKVGQHSDHFASSAGILAYDGSPISNNAKKVLCHFHIPVNHSFRSRSISPTDMKENQYVLTMEKYQANLLKNQFGSFSKKISPLSRIVNKDNDIADPFPHNLDNYFKTFEQIKSYIDDVIKEIFLIKRMS
jgi:protein-tyrosine-phosphatase